MRGTLYNGLDYLDVLETLEDNTFDLILINPLEEYVKGSKRVCSKKSGKNSIAVMVQEMGIELRDLKEEEIQAYLKQEYFDKRREYEKYFLKIVQNCSRILWNSGVLVYVGPLNALDSEGDYFDITHALECYFHEIGTFVLDSNRTYERGESKTCQLIHLYSKNARQGVADLFKALNPTEKHPYIHYNTGERYCLSTLLTKRNANNNFEWHCYTPKSDEGWKYSKAELERKYHAGMICDVGDSWEEIPPQEKVFDIAKPVRDFPLHDIDEYVAFLFDYYAYPGSRVLGIDCPFYYMDMAEADDYEWTYIYSGDIIQNPFMARQVNNTFSIETNLEEHEARVYDEDIPLLTDFLKRRKDRCVTQNVLVYPMVGKTADEILLFHINDFIDITDCSDSSLEAWKIVSRPKLNEIRNNVWKTKKTALVQERKRETIIKIAVYTDMTFDNLNLALKDIRYSINENNPQEAAIVEWMCREDLNRDIEKLNELIEQYGTTAGWSKEQCESYVFTPLPNDVKEKIKKRK